jgi:hypothetical protein
MASTRMTENPYQSPNAVPHDAKAEKKPFRLSRLEALIVVLVALAVISILLQAQNSAPRRRVPPTPINVAPQ